MKSLFQIIAFTLVILSTTSCGRSIDQELLKGTWKGTSFTLDGKDLNSVDPTNARLEIRADKTYSFVDPAGKNFNGTFSTLADMLYLHREGEDKKSFQVTNLTETTLELTVAEGFSKSAMTFVRE